MAAADKNVLPLSFDDSSSSNYGSVAQYTQKVASKNVSISNTGVPNGDVVFELQTGMDTFLDLYKSYISMSYSFAGANNTLYVPSSLLLRCMFSRAVCKLGGRVVSVSNNYTTDSIISARLSGGYDYNKNINGLYDIPDMANDDVGVTPIESTISIDRMDALWLRTPEGLVVPPNNSIRFEFTIDPNYLAKIAMKTTAIAGVGAITVNNFTFHATYYVNEEEAKRFTKLRFVNINSFISDVSANSKMLQYTVNPSIIKAVVAHYAPNANILAAADRKYQTAYLFNGGLNLNTCQFRLGNISIPTAPYDFTTYGYIEAYQDYINQSNQLFKDSGKEPFTLWQGAQAANVRNNWGKLIVADITKPELDIQNSLEVSLTYAGAQPAGTMVILASLEEQIITIKESAAGIVLDILK